MSYLEIGIAQKRRSPKFAASEHEEKRINLLGGNVVVTASHKARRNLGFPGSTRSEAKGRGVTPEINRPLQMNHVNSFLF